MNNYCPEIYKGLFVDRWNVEHIKVGPCCQSTMEKTPTKDFNFTTNSHLQYLRKQFNQGKKPKECNRCWHAESVGQTSRRQRMIEFFDTDDTVIELSSLDHNATWACNSACVMCTPYWSSLWASELKLKKEQLASIGRYHRTDNAFLDKLDLSKLQKVHFNGGEPLLNQEHQQVLERLLETGKLADTFISYNTNGTLYPDKRTIELWSKARLVRLYFSIDAIGSAFNYIRYPGEWSMVENNLQQYKQNMPSNVLFGFNVTVAGYNVLEMPALYKWFEDNLNTNREGDPSDFNWQFAYNFDPKDLCTDSVKHAIIELKPIEKLGGIVNHLKTYKTDNSWVKKLDEIDKRRNTNWRKSLKIGKFYD